MKHLFLFAFLSIFACGDPAPTAKYKDVNLTFEERATDLVAQMTLST